MKMHCLHTTDRVELHATRNVYHAYSMQDTHAGY